MHEWDEEWIQKEKVEINGDNRIQISIVVNCRLDPC